MPGGDGTGPAGMGPMTGRAAGYCAGYGTPGFANPMGGRGFRGRGFFGRGRGWRNRFYATGMPGWMRAGYGYPYGYGSEYASPAAPTAEQEKEELKQQAQYMQESLDAINNRISELEEEMKK